MSLCWQTTHARLDGTRGESRIQGARDWGAWRAHGTRVRPGRSSTTSRCPPFRFSPKILPATLSLMNYSLRSFQLELCQHTFYASFKSYAGLSIKMNQSLQVKLKKLSRHISGWLHTKPISKVVKCSSNRYSSGSRLNNNAPRYPEIDGLSDYSTTSKLATEMLEYFFFY